MISEPIQPVEQIDPEISGQGKLVIRFDDSRFYFLEYFYNTDNKITLYFYATARSGILEIVTRAKRFS